MPFNKNIKLSKHNNHKKYLKFLPNSFIEDKTSPFFASFLWLQKLGRIDLINDSLGTEENVKFLNDSEYDFKFDPTFQISKKKKKKKNLNPIIFVGKSREEKIMVFTIQETNQISDAKINHKKIEKFTATKVNKKNLFIMFAWIFELKIHSWSNFEKILFSLLMILFTLLSKILVK